MTVAIRTATAADWTSIQSIFKAAGTRAWSHIFSPEGLDQLKTADRWLETIKDSQERSFYVAEAEGQIAGFSCVRPSPAEGDGADVAELDALYTNPNVWGKGVGRALLEHAQEVARQRGFTEMRLWTAELNHRPRAVYEKGGWRTTGQSRTRTLFGTEVVELRYAIDL